ncbi:hypothetical protein NB557_02885 [Vibrio alginolyticus]|nr:hypothetical protein [Vibrio alginolyticus]
MILRFIKLALRALPSGKKLDYCLRAFNKTSHAFNQTTRGMTFYLMVSELNESYCVHNNGNAFQPGKLDKASHPDASIQVSLKLLAQPLTKDTLEQNISVNTDSHHLGTCIQKEIVSGFEKLSANNALDNIYQLLGIRNLKPGKINIHNVTYQDLRQPEDVDYIRDQAIKLEKTNLSLSLKLMELALQARPNGTLINQKVNQYRQTLGICSYD